MSVCVYRRILLTVEPIRIALRKKIYHPKKDYVYFFFLKLCLKMGGDRIPPLHPHLKYQLRPIRAKLMVFDETRIILHKKRSCNLTKCLKISHLTS